MKKKILLAFVLSLIICLAISSVVQADIAPPLQPPGAAPGLPEYVQTSIQMAMQNVTIYVEDAGRLYYGSTSQDTVNARVTATYDMFNPDSAEKTLDVIFPLTNTQGYGDGRFNYPEVQDFSVSVEGEPLTWEAITTPNPSDETAEPVKWAQFDVNFLPGELTFINISYDVQSTGYLPIAAFSYILETGAAWDGPIGEAYINLVLPYEASEENVLIANHSYYGMGGENNPKPEFNGNKVIWHWTNLEPAQDDNWAVEIFAPYIWQEVVDLREKMAMGEVGAASELTRWYDALIIDRGIRQGAEGLVPLNIEAYKQAISENEYDDEARARYASFLLFLYEFGRESDKYPGMLDEIYLLASNAQEINQLNPTALDVLNRLEDVYSYEPPLEKVEPAESENMVPVAENVQAMNPESVEAESQANFDRILVYVLGGALAVSLLVIILLVARLRQKT